MKDKIKSASMAWLQSLPWVLGGPICGWLLFCVYGWVQEPALGLGAVIYYTCLFGGIGGVIHLIAYLLFGLPLFHFGYRNPNSSIWKTKFAISFGGVSGYAAFLAVLVILRNGDILWGGEIRRPDLVSPLVGLVYGVWTATCAVRQKPKDSEQDGGGQPATRSKSK